MLLSLKDTMLKCFYSYPFLKIILQRPQDAPLPPPGNPLSPAGVGPLSWAPQQATEGQVLAGICKMLVGNRIRPIWGPRAPSQLAQEPWATFPCKRRASPPLALVRSSPRAAAAVSLRASPSLLLCSPHLCRSRCCGSELHGETPLQVRFLGVWSVPSFPHPSPALPKLVTSPSPSPSH